jgi:coatomer protein complex subunit alpha (xenin)
MHCGIWQFAYQIRELVIVCREYIIGLTVELERQRVTKSEPTNVKRQLELAAYFTHCRLQPNHSILTLRQAMGNFSKAKNYATAATFAKRVMAASTDEKVLSAARQVQSASDRNPRDTLELDYDHFSQFEICAGSLTPIYQGQASVEDPYTGARYKTEYAGKLCAVTQVTEVGKAASGLRLSV